MKKKPIGWFIGMVGKDVAKGKVSLLNPPVKVESIDHAAALHAQQDKGYRFNNKIK